MKHGLVLVLNYPTEVEVIVALTNPGRLGAVHVPVKLAARQRHLLDEYRNSLRRRRAAIDLPYDMLSNVVEVDEVVRLCALLEAIVQVLHPYIEEGLV